MNNLYHKVTVASICTALSFTLATNKEAKAATFNLTATPFFIGGTSEIEYSEYNAFRSGYSVEKASNFNEGSYYDHRAFYEFNIGNLSLDTNTVITRAILNTPLSDIQLHGFARHLTLELVGYVGNGKPDLSDFYAGGTIAEGGAVIPYPRLRPLDEINFDVTNFINQQVRNGDDFAGLSIRVQNFYRNGGSVTLKGYYGQEPSLIIETAEPVPEPVTIFGSALALGVGGWLKRKKSSQQNKTTSQH
jgi:hypothetical protein